MKIDFTKEGLEKQKALVGEFVIHFEDLNDWIRFLIPRIIYKKFDNDLQLRNINCLTEGLSSDQLRNKFDSLIADNFKDLKKFIKVNQELSTKTAQFTTIRNSIVHGSYRLGWKNLNGEMNDSSFSLKHSKSTKKGFEQRSMIISIENLKELNQQLKLISYCYNLIASVRDTHWNYENLEQTEKYVDLLDKEVKKLKKPKLEHLEILK